VAVHPSRQAKADRHLQLLSQSAFAGSSHRSAVADCNNCPVDWYSNLLVSVCFQVSERSTSAVQVSRVLFEVSVPSPVQS